jgi:hypothetical protein
MELDRIRNGPPLSPLSGFRDVEDSFHATSNATYIKRERYTRGGEVDKI